MDEKEFVIVWEDKSIALASAGRISSLFDLADFEAMEFVAGIYAVDENGVLVRITLGPKVRTQDSYEDYPLYYAHAPIMAGTRVAGYVHYTDH